MDEQTVKMLMALDGSKVSVDYAAGRNIRFSLTGKFTFDHVSCEGWLAMNGKNQFIAMSLNGTGRRVTVTMASSTHNGLPNIHVS